VVPKPKGERFNPLYILKQLMKCDGVIYTGGNLFQDETSLRNFVYYYSIALAALKMGKKVFLISQGLGPLKSKMARRLLRKLFAHKRISGCFRDRVSLKYANHGTEKFFECVDVAAIAMDGVKVDTPLRNVVTLVLNERPNVEELIRAFKFLKLENIRILSMSPLTEKKTVERVLKRFNEERFNVELAGIGLEKALSSIASSSLVVTHRLHGALTALYYGIPFVTYGSPKNVRTITNILDDYDLFFKNAEDLAISIEHAYSRDFQAMKEKYRESCHRSTITIGERMKDFFT